VDEVKASRGSPHGGVFLDITWIKEKMPNAAEHIKKKLPSMYHQFMQLANLDITKEPMEVGPTTHYIMGGVRVDAETQMSNVPGLFAAGEVAAGLHGANRLGGNSLSDLLVFGKRAGEFAAKFAREHDAGQIHDGQIEEAALEALEPFERAAKAAGNAEGPYQVQIDLQEMMQSLVGIVRRKEEMVRALDGLGKLWKRSQNVAVHGHREYNPGWHTAIDLKHLLTVSEAITRSALERKESRGGHFRDDFPNKDAAGGKMNIVLRNDVDGSMRVRREPIPERFSKSGAATRTAETSWSTSRKFPRAWSCSTPSTRFKRRRPMTSPAGGIAKLANAVPAQRKLMACRSSCA
jgi:succinate dehydrogenase / fumarate reductase flavoprotein subunit